MPAGAKYSEDVQETMDEQKSDAEFEKAAKEAQNKTDVKLEKKDNICLPDLKKSLNIFKRLIEDAKRLEKENNDFYKILDDNDIKDKKELEKRLKKIKRYESSIQGLEERASKNEAELAKQFEKIKGLEETETRLEGEKERLKEENAALKKKLKEKDSKNNESTGSAKTVKEQNPQKVAGKFHVEIKRVSFERRGWYDIVPYEGKLKDITQKKIKQTSAQIKQGTFKKKKINVSVDKDKGIIYMPKNMFNDNEEVLRAADTTIEVTEPA